MPLLYPEAPLDSGDEIELVKPGVRITGLACIAAPRGVIYAVRIGNNPDRLAFSGKGTWVFRGDLGTSDTTQGVYVRPARPAPGLVLVFQVSTWAAGQ